LRYSATSAFFDFVLQGQVPSYNLKQAAQVAAMGVLGIEEMRNDLEVVP